MTKEEYDKLDTFPVDMVTLVPYRAEKTKLRRGGYFIGVKKEKIGESDFSIIDANGHPHYYDGCDLLYKDK